MAVRPHESAEYRAALEAQQDYDSTTEGRRALEAQLAACTDEVQRRGLRARLVTGAAARRFRSEQAALMPPAVRRADLTYAARLHLANVREDMARTLGFAAAEADHWGRPTQATAERLLACASAVLEADREASSEFVPEHHPGELQRDRGLTAPWVSGDKALDAAAGDVGVLQLLGVEARWDGGSTVVVEGGDLDAAQRWGYVVDEVGPSRVVVSAPAITRWFKRQASGRS